MKQLIERFQWGGLFTPADCLQTKPGLPTGWRELDDFLLTKGLPKGELSLFMGSLGSGATSLWTQTVRGVHSQNLWAAWINSSLEIFPGNLQSQDLSLEKLLVVQSPDDEKQLFWILQELISSQLFETIGCHLHHKKLKTHQLEKLKRLARTHQVALVLIQSFKETQINPLFHLVIEFSPKQIQILRAVHRPTPQLMIWRQSFSLKKSELQLLPNHFDQDKQNQQEQTVF
jgi:hypothetical protein